ncbi:hypothetical protein ABZY90_19720 [Streptomyces sp. NPDC006422]|uniref:hypothetical protein n=1 Tax=unclassified Streptomyces TaxID=2593676 RepID=UPI0033B4C114
MVTNPSHAHHADADLIADALATFDLAYFSEQRRHDAAEAVLAALRRATTLAPADQAARRDRYAAAMARRDGHTWPTEFEDDERDYRRRADAAIAVADQEQAELRRERDLAIAHDRQPYPTAWAYEQACAALRRKTDAIERVLAFAASLDDIARQTAGLEAVHPVAAHIRHQLDTTADEEQHAEPVGENPTEADVDRMLAEGVPVQIVTGPPSTFTTQPPAADADQAANARLASGLRALMAHDTAEQPT